MSKHTPGPWFQGTGDYAYCVYDKRVWLNPDGSRGGDTPNLVVVVSPEDAIADARLIAAAPELLEALRIAREIVVTERDAAHQGVVNPSTGVIDDSDDADWVAEYDRALAQIDTAIAKATGEKA